MDTTLNSMATKKPEPSAEEIAARELVRLAKEQGLFESGSHRVYTAAALLGLRRAGHD